MSEKTCKDAIDYFYKLSASKGREIIIYGGEPLLNRKICEKTIEIVRDRDEEASILLITNGSLIDEEIAKFLAKNKVKVSVSIDGPKEINDKFRKDKTGKGTFDRTLRNYKILKNYTKPAVSCTISAHNVKILPEVAEWIISELEPHAIGFNLPIVARDSPYHVDPELLAEKLLRAQEICRSHGVYEDRVDRKVVSWVKKQIYPTDCAGIGCQIVVAPDGSFGPCHGLIGTEYFSKEGIENKKFGEFASRHPFNMQECYSCEAVGICGGGCAYRAWLNYKTIWMPDEDHCIFAKRILEKMIWDAYARTKI
jgi:uncharacterized protein